MRPASITVTGVTTSSPIVLSPYSVGTQVGAYATPGSGATVTVEVTPDDPFAANPVWYPTGVTALTALTAAAAGLLPPARAVRMNQTVGATLSTLKVVVTGI